MTIHDVMTSGAECAKPDESLADAACQMRDLDVGSLPVCGEGDKLVGMITDRDITIRAVARGADPRQVLVRDVMTPNITCCYEADDISEAARIMEQRQIRRLCVLNSDKRLVGILSLGDLAIRARNDEMSGEVLTEVSEPTHSAAMFGA